MNFARLRKNIGVSLLVGLGFFLFAADPAAAVADGPTRINMNRATLELGFTVETKTADFRLGVLPGSMLGRDRISVLAKPVDPATLKKIQNKTLASTPYIFDIVDRDSDNPMQVTGPLWMTIDWNLESNKGYWLGMWDGINERWVELPSTTNYEAGRVQAAIHLPYAMVAVFEKDQAEFTGQASWMNWEHGAAMTLLPVGQRIEVEDPSTGKTVETVVATVGPFSPAGRIIDLPASIFSRLAPLSSGVINGIIVRPIEN